MSHSGKHYKGGWLIECRHGSWIVFREGQFTSHIAESEASAKAWVDAQVTS
jgi:hypothetical protein